jgi:membrane protein EpsK
MSDAPPYPEAKARLLPNVAANVLYLAIATAVGLWQVPYLIDRLGVALYGQIGVLQSIINYASLLTFAVTWTVCRYVAIRLGRNDPDGVNVHFNTALIALLVMSAVLMAAALGVRAQLPGWIDTPAGSERDAGWLLALFMFASCATALNSPFSSIPFARHRFDLINLIRAFGLALQVVTLIACFAMGAAGLADYGWAVAAKEWVVLFLTAALAVHMWPALRVRAGLFRRAAFRDMAGMSLWSTLDRVGYLLYFSIDLILINAVLGSEACGRYAPLTQLSFMLSMFAMAVTQAFWPIAYEHIAQERIDTLIGHTRRTTRLMGLVFALPVGLLCGLAKPVLAVWLRDPAWAPYAPLLVLLVAPAIVSLPLRHLFSLTHGLNKVRAPAFITLGGGALNLALSYLLLTRTPLGVAGVALSTGLSLTVRNAVIIPIYTARVLDRPRGTFVAGIWPGIAGALILAPAAAALHAAAGLDTLPRLLAGGALLSAVYGAIVFFAVLSKADRAFVLSMLPSRLSGSAGRPPPDPALCP